MAFSPYIPHPGMGLFPAELLPNTPVLISGNPPLPLPGVTGPKPMRSDKLEVIVKKYVNTYKMDINLTQKVLFSVLNISNKQA
jgi:hypothetical protein